MGRMLVALAAITCLMSMPTGAAELPAGTPEKHGFSSDKLADVVLGAGASRLPIHSLLVMRGGEVLLDAAFYPYDGASLHDLASVTKSVTTTLIGIAAGEGKLDLDAPMVSFFPGRPMANLDDRKARISVRQLSQNLSGLACIGYPEEITLAQMEASPDFVQFALDLPMAAEPGTRFDYCSPGMHLLSAILSQATGKTAFAYAQEKLFGPLGITNVAWDADPQGITRGWGDLHMVPHDMARLGALWLAGGAWAGEQVIPADWLAQATTGAVESDRYEDYGYGFWVGPKNEPIPYFFASGRGGQRILPAAALDLIIVTTGGGFDPGDVIDPVVAALGDPAGALPDDPEGLARLSAAVAGVAQPPAGQPVAAAPPIAAAISGKTYRFPANPAEIEALRLDFPGGTEAQMTLTIAGEAVTRAMGLDGVYRWSPGEHGIPIGISGRWEGPETLVADYNSIADIRAYTITLHYAADALEMTIAQRDEASTFMLTGRAE